MESIRYLRALLRSWWLVLLVVIASGAGGYLVYSQTTPLYQSSIRLIVASQSPGTDPVSAKALASARAISLAGIATTPPAIADALKEANRTTNGTLSVTAAAVDQTFTINVSDADPKLARDVAAAFQRSISGSQNRLAGVTGTPYKLNVLNAPAVPSTPYAPDYKNDIGLGLAAGLVIGLAIAVLRETFNRTVRDSDALRDLTGLTVLGTVPKDMARKNLPARTDPRSPRAEAYRQIRTTLISRTSERPLVISITSATLGEGKTSVAANLAAILSRAGHRVALVDADMRRPRVSTFYEIDPEFGLSEVLSGVARLDEALVSLDDGTLAILTAGRIPTDPAELLDSQAMVDTLATLAADREFVIIDTPPVLPVTDALIVAPLTHGVIFVSKLMGSTDDRILRAIEGIDRVNGTILGIVPNQATMGADRDYSYSYRYAPTRRRSDRRSTGRSSSADLAAERKQLEDDGRAGDERDDERDNARDDVRGTRRQTRSAERAAVAVAEPIRAVDASPAEVAPDDAHADDTAATEAWSDDTYSDDTYSDDTYSEDTYSDDTHSDTGSTDEAHAAEPVDDTQLRDAYDAPGEPTDLQDGDVDFAEFGGDEEVLDERASPIHEANGHLAVQHGDQQADDDGGLDWLHDQAGDDGQDSASTDHPDTADLDGATRPAGAAARRSSGTARRTSQRSGKRSRRQRRG